MDGGFAHRETVRIWQEASEYLSGNVKQKLRIARNTAETHPEYQINVEALTQVIPEDIPAADISVRLGTAWIDKKYYKQFLNELLDTDHRASYYTPEVKLFAGDRHLGGVA